MKDGVRRRVFGPAVAAFDAQMEAEASGILYTPEQWSFARRRPSGGLPAPRARGSVTPLLVEPDRTTQQIPEQTLQDLMTKCRRPLAHTCPARRR